MNQKKHSLFCLKRLGLLSVLSLVGMIDRDDKVRRAFAQIAALQQNVRESKDPLVGFGLIEALHRALSHLKDAGYDIEDFSIPSNQMDRYGYSGELKTERLLFLTKVDAALGYFQMEEAEPKPRIGFTGTRLNS